jgi:hypothetical protein
MCPQPAFDFGTAFVEQCGTLATSRVLLRRNKELGTSRKNGCLPMELYDLLASDIMLEMAYTQKKAERIITGLEKPLNDTLLKLWTDPKAALRIVWVEDAINWIDEISEIVLRPANTRPSHIFYYKLLFFEPFGGGAAVPNLLRRLRRLHRLGLCLPTNVTPDDLVKRLQVFHRDLASLCASNIMRDNQIRTFLAEH